MTRSEFSTLLDALAHGWRTRDYAAVASHFTEDVQYGDPTRYMLAGRTELLEFFRADDDMSQHMQWHLMLFDEVRQMGAAEYTYEGTLRYHGVALIQVRDGRISHWREYQHTDSRAWRDFAGATTFPGQV